jgi:glycosyltransferase involved in cell wall biosynthesis
VLHVLAAIEAGGLESVVRALVLGARGSMVQARVAAVIPAGGSDHPFVVAFRDTGVEVFPIEVPPRGYLKEREGIALLCRKLRPHVVHTHGYRADVLDASVARSLGIPVVSTVHGFTGGDRKNRFYQWLQRRALRRFNAVVAVSRPLRNELARTIPSERLHYVQNAFYAAEAPVEREAACRALGVPPDGFRVGWVGRLSAEKGPDILLEALAQLQHLPLSVSFIGAGPMRGALEARAAALRVTDRINWHGTVAGAARLLRAFDVLVLTSRTEGTPVVVLEAMAAGVPIIAADVGGVPDVVSPSEALLVPPGNPRGFARALEQVLQHPTQGEQRTFAARARLERGFGLRPWLARYEAVYRACLAGNRTVGSPS